MIDTKIKRIRRRKIDEVSQVHPSCFYWLIYNGYTDIQYEYYINNVGRIDFIATSPEGILTIFECKNNLYNQMALNKSAAQAYTYVKATKARQAVLVVPEETVYNEAEYDLNGIFKELEIYILELPILERRLPKTNNAKNFSKSKSYDDSESKNLVVDIDE